ncbi:hypothetical protein C3L33_18832, partial [Rhododendron williamsianum]
MKSPVFLRCHGPIHNSHPKRINLSPTKTIPQNLPLQKPLRVPYHNRNARPARAPSLQLLTCHRTPPLPLLPRFPLHFPSPLRRPHTHCHLLLRLEPVSAVPSSVLIKRFFVAYLWVSLIMATYNVAFLGCYVLSMVAKVTRNPVPLLALALFGVICLSSADDASLCRLAGVVSGLEPVYGFVAMEKCYVLLKARNPAAARLVFAYLLVYGSIGGVYGSSVLHGGLDYGVIVMYLLGGCLVGWSVVLILLGRMVRCVLSSSDFCLRLILSGVSVLRSQIEILSFSWNLLMVL